MKAMAGISGYTDINKNFLEKLAVALAKKRVLTMADIKAIGESCKITPVAL